MNTIIQFLNDYRRTVWAKFGELRKFSERNTNIILKGGDDPLQLFTRNAKARTGEFGIIVSKVLRDLVLIALLKLKRGESILRDS